MAAYSALALVSGIAVQATSLIANAQGAVQAGDTPEGPYRPPQFSEPATYSITVAATQSQPGAYYVFDCIHRAAHAVRVRPSDNPVQTGSAITANVVLEPARITLEIGMSDALDSYSTGMWTGDPSKSVSAFQTMLEILNSRQLLTLSTRLATYENMLLESVEATEESRTRFGLRAILTFRELFLASVGVQTLSARPQTTNSTPQGQIAPTTPTPAVVAQHQVLPVSSSGTVNDGSGGESMVTTGTDTGSENPVNYIQGGGNYTSGNAAVLVGQN